MNLSERRADRLAVGGLLVLATALRLAFLTVESLWVDEAATLYYVRRYTYRQLLFEVPITETHPRLYYPFMKAWTAVAGTSVVSLRLPAVLFGVGTVAVTYAIGRRLYTHRVGLGAGALVAVSRFHVKHAQSVRMYTLLSLVGLLSFLAFVRLRNGDATRDRVGYVVATTLAIYTHVFGLFVVIVQNLYVWTAPFLDRVGDTIQWRRWILLQGAVAALTAPWAFVLVSRVLAVSSGGPPLRLSWIPRPTLAVLPQTVGRYFGIGWLVPRLGESGLVVVAVGSVAVIGVGVATGVVDRRSVAASLSWLREAVDDRTYLLGLWAVVPIALLFVVSYVVVPLYVVRYTILASFPLYVLVAAGVDGLGRKLSGSTAGSIAAVAAVLLVVSASLPGYYAFDQNEAWDEVAADVEAAADADDLVLVTNYIPGFIQTKTAFEYYFDRPNVTVTGIPDGLSSSRLRNLTAGHETVWIAFSHTVPAHARAIRAQLNETYAVAEVRYYHSVALYRYERRSVAPSSNHSSAASISRRGGEQVNARQA
ncbi:MAG: glycosyltransferase family 39 protein [Halorientalis sp.]